jgi:hypothetical protein
MSTLVPDDRIEGDAISAVEYNQSAAQLNNVKHQALVNASMSITNKTDIKYAENLITLCREGGFNVGGSANSITLTTNSIFNHIPLTAYITGMTLTFIPSANNTGSVSINIDSLGVKTVKTVNNVVLTGGMLAQNKYAIIRYNGTDFILLNANEGGQNANYGTPYSVTSAKTDANGYANFAVKTSDIRIDFDTNSGANPIVIRYPNGNIESNTTMEGVDISAADGTYYLIKEEGSNSYQTTLQPVEQYTAPVTPATNQLWLDISVKPYIPKKWNGSAWATVQFVKLGQFTKTSGVIGTPISYGLNGRYKSSVFSVTVNSNYSINHNIGTNNLKTKIYFNDNMSKPFSEIGRFFSTDTGVNRGMMIALGSSNVPNRNIANLQTATAALVPSVSTQSFVAQASSGNCFVVVETNF